MHPYKINNCVWLLEAKTFNFEFAKKKNQFYNQRYKVNNSLL